MARTLGRITAMAGHPWEKRQREKAKRERKEAKRARRTEKREAKVGPVEEGPSSEELMSQFAALNREHDQGTIDETTFKARRNELWLAMGLPID